MTDNQLLKSLQEKYKEKNTCGFNFFDFLHAEGSPFEALFYSRLFWPKFVEVYDMIFLKETIEDEEDKNRLNQAIEIYKGDKTKIEHSFNLVPVAALFGKNMDQTSDEEDFLLAQQLKEMWQAKLNISHSNRKCKVEITEETTATETLCLIFYTNR